MPGVTEEQVYIFDVGQGDCILVKTGQHSMLIDAGDSGQGNLILGYLSDREVSKLDYLVATHPHADHIGSMPDIIRAMEDIGSLLMPDVIHTTKTFEDLLDAIEDTETPVIIPQPGEAFEMGDARIQILAPNNSQYEDINNYSIVLRVDFGDSSFLLTGDAEDISESEQLTLEAAVPYRKELFGKEKRIEDAQLSHADKITILSERYHRSVFHVRNRYMVDNSELLICYYDGKPGGTAYTVEYARDKKLQIVNIAIEEVIT